MHSRPRTWRAARPAPCRERDLPPRASSRPASSPTRSPRRRSSSGWRASSGARRRPSSSRSRGATYHGSSSPSSTRSTSAASRAGRSTSTGRGRSRSRRRFARRAGARAEPRWRRGSHGGCSACSRGPSPSSCSWDMPSFCATSSTPHAAWLRPSGWRLSHMLSRSASESTSCSCGRPARGLEPGTALPGSLRVRLRSASTVHRLGPAQGPRVPAGGLRRDRGAWVRGASRRGHDPLSGHRRLAPLPDDRSGRRRFGASGLVCVQEQNLRAQIPLARTPPEPRAPARRGRCDFTASVYRRGTMRAWSSPCPSASRAGSADTS